MAAASGNSFVLKVGDGATSEAFTTLAGLRNTSFSINNSPVDITTKDSAHWQTLLSDGGVQAFTMSADGVFTDAAVDETFRGYAFDNTLNNYQIVFPNGDTIEGSMLVTAYERNATNDDAEFFSLTLQSSGAPTFTAA